MKRVLIVDDDFDICEALQGILEPRYRVTVAFNGEQALALLEQTRFDAVVLDLMMPRMDGETLVQEMSRRLIDVPVVLASAATHLPSRARRAGAAAWLQKPFEASELEQALSRVLGRGDSGPSGNRPGGASCTVSGSGLHAVARALSGEWRLPIPGAA